MRVLDDFTQNLQCVGGASRVHVIVWEYREWVDFYPIIVFVLQ